MRAFLVLPTFNEAPNLARLVAAVRDLGRPLPMIVVDDASADGTGKIADELSRVGNDLTVVHRTGPRGFGEALTAGFKQALARGAEAVLTMDCDFSHDPAALPALLDALREAEVVIGSRYAPGGQIHDWPHYRRALSATANAFVRVLFRLPARDCTSGFRAYRRAVLEGVPWESFHSTGYSFLVELLHWICRDGRVRLVELPICFRERREGHSKMGLREIFRGAANLLRLRLSLRGRAGEPATPGRAAPHEAGRAP